jgi:hypothetical protein
LGLDNQHTRQYRAVSRPSAAFNLVTFTLNHVEEALPPALECPRFTCCNGGTLSLTRHCKGTSLARVPGTAMTQTAAPLQAAGSLPEAGGEEEGGASATAAAVAQVPHQTMHQQVRRHGAAHVRTAAAAAAMALMGCTRPHPQPSAHAANSQLALLLGRTRR